MAGQAGVKKGVGGRGWVSMGDEGAFRGAGVGGISWASRERSGFPREGGGVPEAGMCFSGTGLKTSRTESGDFRMTNWFPLANVGMWKSEDN